MLSLVYKRYLRRLVLWIGENSLFFNMCFFGGFVGRWIGRLNEVGQKVFSLVGL